MVAVVRTTGMVIGEGNVGQMRKDYVQEDLGTKKGVFLEERMLVSALCFFFLGLRMVVVDASGSACLKARCTNQPGSGLLEGTLMVASSLEAQTENFFLTG